MSAGRWRRTTGHNRRERWESDLGTAYVRERPPGRDPLTPAEVQALPNGSRVLVLWGGGNGPHEYEWRDGRVFGDNKDRGTLLGGLIGSWGLVGNKPYMDKVWLADGPQPEAEIMPDGFPDTFTGRMDALEFEGLVAALRNGGTYTETTYSPEHPWGIEAVHDVRHLTSAVLWFRGERRSLA